MVGRCFARLLWTSHSFARKISINGMAGTRLKCLLTPANGSKVCCMEALFAETVGVKSIKTEDKTDGSDKIRGCKHMNCHVWGDRHP